MSLPTKPVGLYWESYYGVQGRIINIPNPTDNPNAYVNVIFLFQALPQASPVGSVAFPRGATTATLNADIATCRARGQRIIMTIGGAGAQVDITSQAKADALVQSVKDINVLFGGSGQTAAIDGIDWNSYEGSPASGQWLTYASLKLKDYYGSDFLITSPPAVHGQSPTGQAGLDRAVLAEMHAGGTYGSYTGTALDWMCGQNYDGPGNDTTAAVSAAMDFYNTAVTVNGVSVQIPRSKIGIGFAISTTLANYWTTAEAVACYETQVSAGRQPRGAFNFSANTNPTFTWASDVAPTILGSGGTGTLVSLKRIRGTLTASVKKVRGRLIEALQAYRNRE